MAFIDYIPYDDASEELQALYREYGGPSRTPANIIRIAAHNPTAMKYHVELFRAVTMGKTSLTRQQREMIAVRVSAINKCHY
ncbi:MAG: carboxymuconolactone decarboxylase family protein [candidate division Zixibacteria bacterium]|nr:carboxymuconolactone decarboxylase family protein [candidate division Zixibacteria bacterium]MDH3936647.1 carboxymuconolactone decarboxylase family protein [candidate division Zixibacteria bacterium]MDH4035467.1 carboxymuconolactone decarboxylase family protein [candidate division Zixibacteria bacterium]